MNPVEKPVATTTQPSRKRLERDPLAVKDGHGLPVLPPTEISAQDLQQVLQQAGVQDDVPAPVVAVDGRCPVLSSETEWLSQTPAPTATSGVTYLMAHQDERFPVEVPVTVAAPSVPTTETPLHIDGVRPGEGLMQYVQRTEGQFSLRSFQRILGAAGPYKDGDEAIGVAAANDTSRLNAQKLLSNTRISELTARPLLNDSVFQLIQQTTEPQAYAKISDWTVGELKNFILDAPETQVHEIMPGLPSDAIASVVKLMSNEELVKTGQKIFNPLPGSHIGAKGYLSARLQPNSPTDNPEDVAWQVFDGWSYGVGDLMLGNNPVGSTESAVAGVEGALKDIIHTFGLEKVLPWVVLSHIDVQDKVEKAAPGSTTLYFQSIAGTESANQVFDLSVPRMVEYAKERRGQYGLYLETGQGADATNGQAHGVDMGTLEARKYGFARGLKTSMGPDAWVAVNDVAGFIGPEVFKSKEQLVRVALEDTVMGKLHGLPIGLDICSTLHMPIGLADLDWAIDQIMPANPAYLMALPTKNDPMLSYLTTAFQDHVRVRNQFGYKINEPMTQFFKSIGVIDTEGNPTEHFGDPVWVYAKFRQAKGDTRDLSQIYAEGRLQAQAVIDRGVPLAMGHGEHPWDMNPELKAKTEGLVEAARQSIWSELTPEFVGTIPHPVEVRTTAQDRQDDILHPPTGEVLDAASIERVQALAASRSAGQYDTQIVISDGLNGNAISDPGHLAPFLDALRTDLEAKGHHVAPENLVMHNGRVRAGYRIGEMLFGAGDPTPGDPPRTLIHIIGERPGTPHNNFSAYVGTAPESIWRQPMVMDHDRAHVVCGISDTSLDPRVAAERTAQYATLS